MKDNLEQQRILLRLLQHYHQLLLSRITNNFVFDQLNHISFHNL
jgi:hypothetical protein